MNAPPGEVFTAVNLAFHAEPLASGSNIYARFGYGPTPSYVGQYLVNSGQTTTLAAPLPDAASFWASYLCSSSASTGCTLDAYSDVLAIGGMSLTIHDTGSGVHTVTLSLGATVVATDPSACQNASLTPCPGAVDGTLAANTAAVPDGTYPVILTAYDVSGDADPVQVTTVTVASHVGTTAVRSPARSGRAIRTKVVFKWDPRARTTRMIWTHFGRLPADARVTLTCRGAHCPFRRLRGTGRRIARLEAHLRRRTFSPGDRLTVTITAPHRRAEAGTILIRRGRLPVTVAFHRGHRS